MAGPVPDTIADEQVDAPLARCRMCLAAYCESHLPSLTEIHAFSGQHITCPECTPNFEAPKLSASYLEAVTGDGPDSPGAVETLRRHLFGEIARRSRRVEAYSSILRNLIGDGNVGATRFVESVRRKKNATRE
jgi:hypothetical protein